MARARVPLRLGIRRASPTPVVVIVAALAIVLAACTGGSRPDATPGPDDDRIRVVATTTVLADLVAQVGRDRVLVTSLVPKGGEVHTYDPSPSDLRAVAAADMIVMNGLGLDEWLAAVVENAGADAPLIELAEDLEGVTYLDGGHEAEDGHEDESDDDGHGSVNPHLWLDVANAARYVERIVDALVGVATSDDDADAIRASGAAYLERLGDLDAYASERIAAIPAEDRIIVSFHEAFPYFAEAYGLTIAGTIISNPGQDPSAGQIRALVDAIRETGAKAVFGEIQFSPDLVRTVADEAGVVVESDLYSDSLGDAPADTYEGMMRWNVDRVVAALGG